MSHVKLVAETYVYLCHKNMKSMFFYSFWKVFAEKCIKTYSTGNEEWIQSETARITSDYALRTLSIL